MPATVTDIQAWRTAHPPILMLWNAQCRFAAEWNVALFKLALSFAPLQIGVCFGGRLSK